MGKLTGRRILITGSNRGIGLEMVKQLLAKYNPEKIFTSCRKPEKAEELTKLAKSDPRVEILRIDITDVSSFGEVVRKVGEATEGNGIHVLINNAGVYINSSQSLEELTMETMIEYYRVNTLGAIFLTQAFLPLLKTANAKGTEKGLVVNFASRLGSISDNTSGGYYASRCSRSAMNAATKSMSIDLKDKNILAVAMNPGWVKTDQGGSAAKLDVDFSVSSLLKVLDEVTEEHSGRLVQYDGQIMEW